LEYNGNNTEKIASGLHALMQKAKKKKPPCGGAQKYVRQPLEQINIEHV
jgi:hypothetical protein